MIGESKQTISEDLHRELTAIRDALVVFFLVLITRMLEVGYPPTVETVYQPLLAGFLMGIVSYMTSMGIKKPEQPTP
jgi:hypothetical protein